MDSGDNMPITAPHSEGQKCFRSVGIYEANAIALKLERQHAAADDARPPENVISDLKANVRKIVVSDLRQHVFALITSI